MASPQSIWLCYTHLGPIQTPPQPVGSSSKAEDGVELLLKKPKFELLDKEGQKAPTFTAEAFFFTVLMLLGAAHVPLPQMGRALSRIPHLRGALRWFWYVRDCKGRTPERKALSGGRTSVTSSQTGATQLCITQGVTCSVPLLAAGMSLLGSQGLSAG